MWLWWWACLQRHAVRERLAARLDAEEVLVVAHGPALPVDGAHGHGLLGRVHERELRDVLRVLAHAVVGGLAGWVPVVAALVKQVLHLGAEPFEVGHDQLVAQRRVDEHVAARDGQELDEVEPDLGVVRVARRGRGLARDQLLVVERGDEVLDAGVRAPQALALEQVVELGEREEADNNKGGGAGVASSATQQ